MASSHHRLKLSIIGCGAIGSRIAISTIKELKDQFMISALYDIDPLKSQTLARKLRKPSLAKSTLSVAIHGADIVVEAVNTPATGDIVSRVLRLKKSVLVMSVGRLIDDGRLFPLAKRCNGKMLLPSGGIAGLDAIKAARLAGITSAILTTTKSPQSFKDNAYQVEKKFQSSSVKSDVVLFDGGVREAVRFFPQNINVAAVLSLAVGDIDKVHVRIIASPKVTRNIHEIVIEGACGRITTRVENETCPDNPKTSYLAVLSAIATLQQYGQNIKIGT
ncbi:MAG: DUF108 domain-containing protein [Candidatus Omnitrophica bacterium]|nr:DUF108 domain-containing protein [Candidatus Omnitrophota bacterium]